MSVEAELQESVRYSPLQRMRHSAAHVMAEAVQEMFPGAKFGIGPAIEDGFYYDFDLPRSLTPGDFPEMEDQLEEEYNCIFEIADLFYSIFDLKYSLRLGTRPEGYIGDLETWNKAEAILRGILDKHVGPGKYLVAEGDGAFYGPKIDILMEDALGRSWQMGTIQLDFQLPRRFDCSYVDKDGQEKTPVVIHRVIYGSLERFIGILIEHTAGAFPTWLAPVQVRILSIADRHVPYAREVMEHLRAKGIRVELDDSRERMNAKVRAAQLQKIPYMLVIGDKEQQEQAVSVRLRTNENLGATSLESFVARITEIINTKSREF
jgi:threonyl-tRNA synthetase